MSSWSDFFPKLSQSTLPASSSKISISQFFELVIQNESKSSSSSSSIDEARRGATMTIRVVTPLSRSICGASGFVTPDILAHYCDIISVSADANGLLPHIIEKLTAGFKSAPPLEAKLQALIDSVASELEDKERICDQLRDAGDTFLVISKVPTQELYSRFVKKMGWSEADADKVSFSIYKKKRPQLPVVVITKTKMEAAASAVDDQDVAIDISGCGLEKEDVEKFADKLASAPLAVTSLDASANTFHRRGADAIIKMCNAAKNLRELSVAGNNIQAPGVVAVVRAVAHSNKELARLDLSNNFLTTEGAQQEGLVEAVKATNPHLVWLGLAGNELCQAPGGEIVAGLIELGKFRTIVLNSNKLGNGGISKMVAAIKNDRALQHLFLDANDLRDDDIVALSGALHDHPTITSLSLKRNPLISALGYTALTKLVKVNPGLVQVTYDECNASQQTNLAQTLDANKKKMVAIHHKMVADAGAEVTSEGLCLWLRMTIGNADLVQHFANSQVDGSNVWSVAGASLEQNKLLSERLLQKEFFPVMEALVEGQQEN